MVELSEKVKKGIAHCIESEVCIECLYDGRDFPRCFVRIGKDALAYIWELEAELEAAKERENGLSIMLTSAQSAAETYKRERDRYWEWIKSMGCETCSAPWRRGAGLNGRVKR